MTGDEWYGGWPGTPPRCHGELSEHRAKQTLCVLRNSPSAASKLRIHWSLSAVGGWSPFIGVSCGRVVSPRTPNTLRLLLSAGKQSYRKSCEDGPDPSASNPEVWVGGVVSCAANPRSAWLAPARAEPATVAPRAKGDLDPHDSHWLRL